MIVSMLHHTQLLLLLSGAVCTVALLAFAVGKILEAKHTRNPTLRELLVFYNRPSMFVVAFVASFMLQISHPELGRIFLSHTNVVHGGDRTRRIVRTFAFGVLWPFATANERRLLASWLHNIHNGIKVYDQKSQVFVLATIAWAVVKCHRLVGSVPETHLDSVVLGIMSMMNFLHEDTPKIERIECPSSVFELDAYIRQQGFDATQAEKLLQLLPKSTVFQVDKGNLMTAGSSQ